MHSTQHSHPHPHSQRVPFASQPQSQSPSIPSNHFYLQNQSIPRTFSPQSGQPHQTTLNSNPGSTPQDNVNHYSTPQNYQTPQQQQHNQNQNQILASPISQSPVPMTPVGLQGGPPTPSSLKGLAPRLSIPQSNNNQSHHQLNMNIQRSPSGSSVNQLQGNNPNGNPQNPPNRTTSMGPPLSANPINQNQNINFQIALNQQQNRNSSISPNASNHLSLSLPGAGMLRMLQYAEGLSTGIQKASYHYWRDFVSEFFLPDATFRLVLWNPASCEQKGFEVPSSVLPRYYHTTCTSGLTSSQVNFENPREHLGQSASIPPPIVSKFANVFPSATSSHFFESSRTNLISTFDNGWQVQMNGSLRASLVIRNNSLKIENLDFTVNAHTSFLPGVAIQRRKVSQKIPLDVIDKIRKDVENEVSGRKIKGESEDDKNKNDPDGDGKKMKKDNRPDTPAPSKRSDGNQDDKSLEEKDEKDADGGIKNESPNSSQRTDRNDENEIGSSYTIMVDQTFLPESPVNEYGITLRAMRCLEITESVCQLRDLIDHSHSRKLGPMEALRNFSDQFRMQQRLQNQNQPQSQNPPGFSPINVNGNNGFATPVNGGGFPAQFGQMNQGSGGGIEMQNGFDRPSPSQNQNQNQSQNQSQVEGSAENGSNANKRKSSVRINSRDPTPSPSQTPKRIAPSPKLGGRRGAITEDDINPNKRAREG